MISNKPRRSLGPLLVAFLMTSQHAKANHPSAQWEEIPEALENPALITLQDVIDEKAIPVEKEAQQAWRPKGASCLVLETSESIDGGKDLFDWNPETDSKTLLLSAEAFILNGEEKPLEPKD